MAEVSLFWETNDTGDGADTGYTDSQLFTLFRALFAHNANLGGVAPETDDELEVTGNASPVSVGTGLALVYGIPYYNTAAVNVAIPTPASQTRIDRIVLRADWSAQTVRVTRIAGSEGGSAPSLTQTPDTTWDIPLAQVSITTGGVITVTDEREWLGIVGNDMVTGAKIAEYAVDPRAHISGQNGIVIDPQNGNSRGNDAVDLQTERSNNSQVASGENSVVGGGEKNTASGSHSTVGGGESNTASGSNSTVGGGEGNVASATHATVAGGANNDATDDYATVGGGISNNATGEVATVGGGTNNDATALQSTVAGGSGNKATGVWSAVPGGFTNTASGESSVAMGKYALADKATQVAQGGGRFAAQGDAQGSSFILKRQTTNNTPTEMNAEAGRLTIPTDTTWAFTILLVARRTDADGESAGYKFEGVIDNNAGTTALVGAVTKTVLAEDTSGWDADVTADDTNDALAITVTGENDKTIRWVARILTAEVTG